MKNSIFSGLALAGMLSLSTAFAQTVGQDLHDAGHDTAHATKTVAHRTAHGTRVATRDTVNGTKRGAHKTAYETKRGYHKTKRGTKRVVRRMDDDSARTPQ
jgi:hypothetical protein